MTDTAPLILFERSGVTAWLTLNRPDRLNAFTMGLHEQLSATLTRIEQDPPRVLVITGAGRGFCSGQDMTERYPQIAAGETVEIGKRMDETYNPLIRRLHALPCVTIAAVNGVAAGAGIGLALAADIIVAARSARFMLAFGKVGLGPDAGVSWGLPARIGQARTLALMLTGDALNADQALAWGLVWKLAEDDALRNEVQALADRLAAGSYEAQMATRNLVRSPSASLSDQLDRERDAQDALGRTAFYRQAVLSFGKKG